jgi:hypothetical protein
MKRFDITLFLIILVFTACTNKKMNTNKQNSETVKHTHSEKPEEIELNNGQKWKVDKAMMEIIRKMERDINSISESSNKDHSELGKKLQANIELLTSNCTMKGKAHDELHKWLLPFIDLVNEYSNNKDLKKSETYYSQLQISMKNFNHYFK